MSDDNDPNEYWGSWMEVFALKIGTENILDFMERIKPETDDINRLAEIEMSLVSLRHMKEYFKRRADEIDEILDNHPAYGNRLKKENTEEYPHRHSTADWKPDLDLVTNISDMIHGNDNVISYEDNIIPFRYKDNNK
jgi:hypothetical protein